MGLMLAEPGFHTRCFVEWEEYPRATIIAAQRAGYFAPAPIWDDLRSFDAQPFRSAFDIILAGYPCQIGAGAKYPARWAAMMVARGYSSHSTKHRVWKPGSASMRPISKPPPPAQRDSPFRGRGTMSFHRSEAHCDGHGIA